MKSFESPSGNEGKLQVSRITELREGMARWVAGPLAQVLATTRITPNALTLTGFVISLGAAFLIGGGHFLAGALVLLGSGFFDMLDGAVARAGGKTTVFGAALDSTLDRYSEAALFFALLWFFLPQGSTVTIVLIYAVLVGSILVSYVRARAEGLGIFGKEGFFTRPERIIVLTLGLLVNQVVIALWLLALLTHFTVLQRLSYIWKNSTPK